MNPFRQIAISELPRGFDWPVALLAEKPERLAVIFGIEFERSQDDLDDLDGVALISDRGVCFVLRYHLNAPIKGTEIVINERSNDPSSDLAEALRVLGRANPTVIWRHPDF